MIASRAHRLMARLKRFDTSAFTLHEHCGPKATAVRDCLRIHGANIDPVQLDESGWEVAPECKPLWEAYRECGLNFFNASDSAQSKCAAENEAFRKCDPKKDDAEHCHALELALAKCATVTIKLRMSGKLPPE